MTNAKSAEIRAAAFELRADSLEAINADLLAALKYADLQLRDYGQIDPKIRAAIAKACQQ